MRTALMLALAFPVTLAAQIQRPGRAGTPVVQDGATPVFTAVPYTPPADPAGFTATVESGKVVLTWQPVAGVTSYLLGGAGIDLYGQRVQASTYTVANLPAGTHEWTVASLNADGQAINNGAKWPHASVTLTPATAVTGRYRITLAGFQVMIETLDDALERDGKRDEVYAAASWALFDRNTRTVSGKGSVRSKTYGDASRWPARVAAGRASASGGLMTGDIIPTGWGIQNPPPSVHDPMLLPMVVWEGSLTNGQEILVIRPSLWEEDADPSTYAIWRQQSEASGFPDYHDRAQHLTEPLISGPFAGKKMFFTAYDNLRWAFGFTADPLSSGKDRPIGLDGFDSTVLSWQDRYFVLTRENLESTLDSRHVAQRKQPPGLLTVWLRDEERGTVEITQHGHYRMLLGIERVP
jgi:hypothetical protein